MQQTWFKHAGLVYAPVHAVGVAVTVIASIFQIPIYTAVQCSGHPASNDSYCLFVYTTCTPFWWKRIAEKTSTQ